MPTHRHTYSLTQTHTQTHTRARALAHAHTHTHTRTHIHSYIDYSAQFTMHMYMLAHEEYHESYVLILLISYYQVQLYLMNHFISLFLCKK